MDAESESCEFAKSNDAGTPLSPFLRGSMSSVLVVRGERRERRG